MALLIAAETVSDIGSTEEQGGDALRRFGAIDVGNQYHTVGHDDTKAEFPPDLIGS